MPRAKLAPLCRSYAKTPGNIQNNADHIIIWLTLLSVNNYAAQSSQRKYFALAIQLIAYEY